VMVELDMRIIATADYVIDMGPGAGEGGGQIVAVGIPAEVATSTESASAPFLAASLK